MPKRTVKGSGKKIPLNMRTTQELREKINRAAGASGRSLVQEVEYRVTLGFAHDRQTAIENELKAINRRMGDATGFRTAVYREMRDITEMLTLIAILLHDKDLSIGEHDRLTKMTKHFAMRPPGNGTERAND